MLHINICSIFLSGRKTDVQNSWTAVLMSEYKLMTKSRVQLKVQINFLDSMLIKLYISEKLSDYLWVLY